MSNEINFLDLAVLTKITPNTPLEKLGGLINSSIFDASNIAGTLKQKSLIEFSANYPGPNSMNITEQGTALIKEADGHIADSFDKLDDVILQNLSGGKRVPSELQTTLNLSPKDLALRLYKESKQGYVIYDIKNGGVDIMLTEKGFLKAKADQQSSTVLNMNPQLQYQQQNIEQNSQYQSNPVNINDNNEKLLSDDESSVKYSNQDMNSNLKKSNMNSLLKNERKRWITILVLVFILIIIFILAKFVLYA